MSNITEIQRLLNEKADLQAQINISAFDGSIEVDRKSTRLNSSHWNKSRMPSSA